MNAPPAVLAGTYVVAYALIDGSVTFVQRKTLAVDGEWLGRVPCIAICQDFKTSGFMVQFCDAAWETIAIAAGYETLEEAQARTESSYLGLSERWQAAALSRDEALVEHEAELEQGSCSFCSRTPLQVDLMLGSDARICNYCIETFHRTLNEGES